MTWNKQVLVSQPWRVNFSYWLFFFSCVIIIYAVVIKFEFVVQCYIYLKVNYYITEAPDTDFTASPPGSGKSTTKKIIPQESESSSECVYHNIFLDI